MSSLDEQMRQSSYRIRAKLNVNMISFIIGFDSFKVFYLATIRLRLFNFLIFRKQFPYRFCDFLLSLLKLLIILYLVIEITNIIEPRSCCFNKPVNENA